MRALLWKHRVLWLPTVLLVLGMVAFLLVLMVMMAIGMIDAPYLGMW